MDEWKDKTEGTVKETVGTVSGDDKTKNEGRVQQIWGNAEGTVKDVKEKVGSAMREGGADNSDYSDDSDRTNPDRTNP